MGRGRPRVSLEERRKKQIRVLLTEEEHKQLKEMADEKFGGNISKLLRTSCIKDGFVYNPLEAKARLEKNRKDYIEKLLKFVNANIEREDYEQAVNYIVVAGDNLKALQGVLDYLDAMKDDGYPEFGTIFD